MKLTRREFLKISSAGVVGLSIGGCFDKEFFKIVAGAKRDRPNILLIMADDMGFSDIGCYGGEINTPNLDRLAANGLRYTQFYNSARCCPSRAALNTGLYPHKTGLGWMTVADLGKPGYIGELNDNCITIAQGLKPAGYHTYISGKWHLVFDKDMEENSPKHNWPLQRGFDKYYGGLAGDEGYYKPRALTEDNARNEAPDENYYYTDAIGDHAAKYLSDHFSAYGDEPFFMYVPFYSPHRPLHAKPEDIAKYKGTYMVGWDVIRRRRYRKQIEIRLFDATWDLSPRDNTVPAWNNVPENQKALWDMRMATYAAMIDCMDQNIGKILAELKNNNAIDNTVIIFISDNGACAETAGENNINIIGTADTHESYRTAWANASNTPFALYKSYVHEGGISSPMIVHWPKGLTVEKGSYCSTLGHVIDIMPTCLELAGAEYPEKFNRNKINPLPGKSLVPTFNGKDVEREALYFEHEVNRAIRKGNWKLVSKATPRAPYTGPWELYDLEKNRTETQNLAEQYPEIVQEMAAMWDKWAQENDVYPLDGRGWTQKIRASIR